MSQRRGKAGRDAVLGLDICDFGYCDFPFHYKVTHFEHAVLDCSNEEAKSLASLCVHAPSVCFCRVPIYK